MALLHKKKCIVTLTFALKTILSMHHPRANHLSLLLTVGKTLLELLTGQAFVMKKSWRSQSVLVRSKHKESSLTQGLHTYHFGAGQPFFDNCPDNNCYNPTLARYGWLHNTTRHFYDGRLKRQRCKLTELHSTTNNISSVYLFMCLTLAAFWIHGWLTKHLNIKHLFHCISFFSSLTLRFVLQNKFDLN